MVEPVRRTGLATGRRDAVGRLLPARPSPPGRARVRGVPRPPRAGGRLRHLLPPAAVGSGSSRVDRGWGGVRALWHVGLVRTCDRQSRGVPPAGASGRRAGAGVGLDVPPLRLATPGRGTRPLHRVRISRSRLPGWPSRRGLGRRATLHPAGRPASDGGQAGPRGSRGPPPRSARSGGLPRLPPSRRRRLPRRRLRQRVPPHSEPGPDHPPQRVRAHFRTAVKRVVASDDHVEQHRRLFGCHAPRVRAHWSFRRSMSRPESRARPLGPRRHEQDIWRRQREPSPQSPSGLPIHRLLSVLPEFMGTRRHCVGRLRYRRYGPSEPPSCGHCGSRSCVARRDRMGRRAGLAGHDVRQGVLAPALLHRGQCRPGGRRRRRRGDRWSPLVRRRKAHVQKDRPVLDRGRGGRRGSGALRRTCALSAPARTERPGRGALLAAASRPLPLRHLGTGTAELRLVFRVGRNQRQRPARSQGHGALHRGITRRQRRSTGLHRHDRVRPRRAGAGPRADAPPGRLRSRRRQVRRDPGHGHGRHRIPLAASRADPRPAAASMRTPSPSYGAFPRPPPSSAPPARRVLCDPRDLPPSR